MKHVKHTSSAATGRAVDAKARCSVSVNNENALPPIGVNDPTSQLTARADERTGTMTSASLSEIVDVSGASDKSVSQMILRQRY